MIGAQPNWAKLVTQGRAKAHGIPWTVKESEALQKGYTADEVRAGIMSEKAREEQGDRDVANKEQVIKEAKKLGISFDEGAATVGDLNVEIQKVKKEKAAKAEAKKIADAEKKNKKGKDNK